MIPIWEMKRSEDHACKCRDRARFLLPGNPCGGDDPLGKKLGTKKIGIASCVGLLKESHLLAGLLREYGFEVYGVGCKIGEVPKTEVGIPERCEEVGVHMCNPILQAQMLNKEKTDINIVMGLCVGHDSLFYKYAEAPSTTLVVKDRVLGNNPVAALYTLDSYYKSYII